MRTFTRRSAVGAASAVACLLTAAGLTSPAQAAGALTPAASPGVVVSLPQAGVLTPWGVTGKSLGDLQPPASLTGVPVTSVSIGNGWALATTATGQLVTWGNDTNAKAALPTSLDPATLVQLVPTSGFGAVGAAAVTKDGHVTTWLSGDPTLNTGWRDTSKLSDVASVAVPSNSLWGVARTNAGTVQTWGVDSSNKVAGVPSLSNVTQVAACVNTGLALTSDGQVHAWGSNLNNLVTNAPTSGVAMIGCALNSAIAVKTDGSILEWGSVPAPDVPAGLTTATANGAKVTSLAANFQGIVARDDQGHLWTWGDSGLAAATVPAQLTGAAISELAAGSSAAYALTPAVLAVGKPTISAATATVGTELHATDTKFSGGATVAGQWYRTDGSKLTPIDGATSTAYTTTGADAGMSLVYRDTATPTSGAPVTADSDPTSVSAPASSVTVTTTPTSYGKAGTATVRVTSGGAVSGSVAVTVDGAAAGTAALAGGTATIALPATLAAGNHTVTAAYAGNATSASASGAAVLSVAKATSTVKVKLPKKAKKAKKVKVKVIVTPSGGTATGKVTVKIGKAKATGTLTNGKATVKVKLAKKAGKQRVKVKYAGDANVTGSTTKATLKVK